MPVIKSAIKKLRKDRKREGLNNDFRKKLAEVIKTAKKTKTPSALKEAYSMLDRAAKNHVIHKNKAARTKSSLAKLVGGTKRASPGVETPKKVKKPSAKHAAKQVSAPKKKTPSKKK